MAVAELNSLPDHSRLWIFESDRALNREEALRIETATREFLDDWVAHGASLTAACSVAHLRFLIIAVDEDSTSASGCSIDRLTRFITRIGSEVGVSLLDRDAVTFRDGDRIERVTRQDFKELAAAGKVTEETIVFDNTVTRLAAVRGSGWEVPAGRSWHARYFGA